MPSLNLYAKIVDALLMEETLLQLQEEILLINEIEHFVNDLLMEDFMAKI